MMRTFLKCCFSWFVGLADVPDIIDLVAVVALHCKSHVQHAQRSEIAFGACLDLSKSTYMDLDTS